MTSPKDPTKTTPKSDEASDEVESDRLRVESEDKAGIFGNSQWSDLNHKNDAGACCPKGDRTYR